MDSRNQDTKLHDALADFERCLHTPVVPGEMGPWLKRATRSFRAVEIVVRRQIEETHSDLLAEIRGEDLGLAARVDALREGDQELCEMMESTRRQLDRLNASVENVEPDEQRLDEEMRTEGGGAVFPTATYATRTPPHALLARLAGPGHRRLKCNQREETEIAAEHRRRPTPRPMAARA